MGRGWTGRSIRRKSKTKRQVLFRGNLNPFFVCRIFPFSFKVRNRLPDKREDPCFLRVVPRLLLSAGWACLYKGCGTFSEDDGTSPSRSLSPNDPLSPIHSFVRVAVLLERVIFCLSSAEAWPVSSETKALADDGHPNLAPIPIHSPVSICPSCVTSSTNSLTNSY